MSDVEQELDNLLKQLLFENEDIVAAAIAEQVLDIMEAVKSGEIDEETKNELMQDAIELAQVQNEALSLETKIKVEAIFDLLVKLATLV